MPRNGSGTYTLPTGNPVVTGTTISSTGFNNTLSDIATALTNSLSCDGQTTPTANLPMGGYKLTNVGKGTAASDTPNYGQTYNQPAAVSVASAATTAIGAAASSSVTITGTATITAFDTVADGIKRDVTFAGSPTLTHNATSLILPGAANITPAPGDCATFQSLGAGNWRCTKYQAAASRAAGSGANSDITSLSSLVSINGGPLSGLRNKHIGGHFDTNPWQRGTSFTVTSSGTYVADRWRIDFDGTANISVAKVALPTAQVINGVFCRYGMKITVNSKSGGTYIRLSQRIEGVDTLTTLAATLQTAVLGSGSFSMPVQARQSFGTGGSPSADVVTPFTSALAVTASMQQLNTGLTVPDISSKALGTGNNDFLATEYDLTNIPVGGYVVIALSGLEYGNQATVWEDRRRNELGHCQRYYARLTAGAAYTGFGLGTVASSTIVTGVTVKLPATMRASPSAIAFSSLRLFDGAAASAVTSLNANYSSPDFLSGEFIASGGGLTLGRAAVLQANNNSAAYIETSVEL